MSERTTTQLRLPNDLAVFVKAEAKETHTSQNAVIVRAVELMRYVLNNQPRVAALTDEQIAKLQDVSKRLDPPLRTATD